MSGTEFALLDTNIILYYLNRRDKTLEDLIAQKEVAISVMTEVELLSFHALKDDERRHIERLFAQILIVDWLSPIKAETIRIRKEYRLKIPDAMIAATAMFFDIPLITSDKVFDRIDDLVVIYYSPQ